MLRAGSQVHIPVSGLGKPPGAKHSPAADGTLILLPGHGGQRFPLIGIVVEHLSGNAAGKFRAVEAVFVAFQRRVILPRAFLQVQHGADQRRVIGVAQRVMGRTGRLDAEHFHGGFQRFLGGGAVGLGIENHLGVVPLLRETLIQPEKPQIFPQNADIVKAPCEEHHVLAAPFPELFDRLGERHALIPQAGFLDTGELADPAVQVPVIPGLHHDLEFILNELLLRHPDGADLDDLPPDVHGQYLFGGRRPRPWLVPFHIQYNIIHRA